MLWNEIKCSALETVHCTCTACVHHDEWYMCHNAREVTGRCNQACWLAEACKLLLHLLLHMHGTTGTRAGLVGIANHCTVDFYTNAAHVLACILKLTLSLGLGTSAW